MIRIYPCVRVFAITLFTVLSSRLALASDTEAAKAPVKNVSWSDLSPQNGKPYSDPFAKLTRAQLMDLGFVMRVRRLIAAEKIPAGGRDAQEAAALAAALREQGVDIAWLMVQHGRVQQVRGLQVERVAEAISQSFQETRVALVGYVIPCRVEQGRYTEFFLVPTVSACSHEDPPPRLQVVFVALPSGLVPPGRKMAIRVSGELVAKTQKRSTFNANGRVPIHAAYTLAAPEVRMVPRLPKSSVQGTKSVHKVVQTTLPSS